MTLIETFTDFVRNKKSLDEYVEIRKTMHERGEFNDQKLIQAEANLQRLKNENPEIYAKMYEVLEEKYRRDEGHYVEYPIRFVANILKMYEGSNTPEKVYDDYKALLTHRFSDA
jgi:hypothetical protein